MSSNNLLGTVLVVVNNARVRRNIEYRIPVSVTQTMDTMIYPILKAERPSLAQGITYHVSSKPQSDDTGL